MSYADLNDLQERLGAQMYARLTDRIAGATANDSVGAELLAQAEALANSYLANRYATPIDIAADPDVARVLLSRVLDLAEYQAWISSPFVSDIPERIRQKNDAALAWLEDIAFNRLPLPASTPPASRTAKNDAARVAAHPRQFTADELDGL